MTAIVAIGWFVRIPAVLLVVATVKAVVSTSLVLTAFVKTPAVYSVSAVVMQSVSHSITHRCVPVLPVLKAILTLCAPKLRLNVLRIANVFWVRSVRIPNAYLDVVSTTTATKIEPVFTVSAKTLVYCPIAVV